MSVIKNSKSRTHRRSFDVNLRRSRLSKPHFQNFYKTIPGQATLLISNRTDIRRKKVTVDHKTGRSKGYSHQVHQTLKMEGGRHLGLAFGSFSDWYTDEDLRNTGCRELKKYCLSNPESLHNILPQEKRFFYLPTDCMLAYLAVCLLRPLLSSHLSANLTFFLGCLLNCLLLKFLSLSGYLFSCLSNRIRLCHCQNFNQASQPGFFLTREGTDGDLVLGTQRYVQKYEILKTKTTKFRRSIIQHNIVNRLVRLNITHVGLELKLSQLQLSIITSQVSLNLKKVASSREIENFEFQEP